MRTLITSSQPEPSAEPRIIDTIEVGGQPLDGAYGAGSFWVADTTGRVIRVDPGTRRVEGSVRIDDQVTSVAATRDGVWAAAGDHPSASILRIDPAGARVVATVLPKLQSQGSLAFAAAGDAVYAQEDQQAPAPLRRIDPRTNRLVGDFGRGWHSALAARGDDLWTLTVNGLLERRDAATGRLRARLDGLAGGEAPSSIAPDANGAWWPRARTAS